MPVAAAHCPMVFEHLCLPMAVPLCNVCPSVTCTRRVLSQSDMKQAEGSK